MGGIQIMQAETTVLELPPLSVLYTACLPGLSWS